MSLLKAPRVHLYKYYRCLLAKLLETHSKIIHQVTTGPLLLVGNDLWVLSIESTRRTKLLWQISIAFAGVNFLIVLFEQRVTLRTELEIEYGLEQEKKKDDGEAAAGSEKGAVSNVATQEFKSSVTAA